VVTLAAPFAVGAFVALGVMRGEVGAQSVRGWVGSTVQMVELRPIAAAPGGCVSDVPCYASLPEERSFAATQDVSLTAWGFGVQGLSSTVLLRGRARLGSDLVWPRTDDRFDALLAYAQIVRGPLTVRAGRQEIRSGLGFPSFDGGTVAWYGAQGALRLEAYGGRSLARGLREPARDALRAVEDFIPDESVLLFGGSARWRLNNLSVTGRYQRELLGDRSGLASERGAVDLGLTTPEGRFVASADYDFGLQRAGKAEASWTRPFAGGRWLASVSALRYVPYFSLSTIWGFFEPVPYHGVQARGAWSPSSTLTVWAGAGWRRYGDTQTETVLKPLVDDGKRGELGGRWAASREIAVEGSYQLEWTAGAFLSSVDAAVRWSASERLGIALDATTFQQIEEFRLGDGRGYGAGASADATFLGRLDLSGGLSILRHRTSGAGMGHSPWNQARAWTSVRVRVGEDPGLANRRAR
jgi:hypothetical protein